MAVLCVCVCACVQVWEREGEREGLVFLVELLSSLWRLLSSPLVAALMRSFIGSEQREMRRRSLLEKGDVDEIITPLS